MKPTTFLVATLTVAIVLLAAEALPGGWQEIEDLKDKHVQEIAEFAVKAYDQSLPPKSEPLKLKSVDGGQKQIVAGTNYKLFVTAMTASEGKISRGGDSYQAIVYESLSGAKKLVSFIQWD